MLIAGRLCGDSVELRPSVRAEFHEPDRRDVGVRADSRDELHADDPRQHQHPAARPAPRHLPRPLQPVDLLHRHHARHRRAEKRQYRRDTIRYDARCYFNVRSKANMSQLNLPHGTDN